MNEDKILTKNKLPGSEKLTRPEEIQQLSKYLKSIRETYDSSIRLEDQLLGVPGRTTGKLSNIDKLDDRIKRTPENLGSKELQGLERSIISISGKIEEVDLETGKVSTPKSKTELLSRLDDSFVKLQDNRTGDTKLSEKRLDLDDNKSPVLPDKKIEISDKKVDKLEDTIINLRDERKNELETKKLELGEQKNPLLDNTRLDLTDRRDVELSKKIQSISDQRITSLSDKRLDIDGQEISKLEDKKLDLSDEREINLSNKKLEISNEEEQKLETKRLDIEEQRDFALEETRLDILDERSISLGDTRIDISNPNDPSLEDTRIDLGYQENNHLEDKRIDLAEPEEPNLGNKRLDISEQKSPELDDTRIDIVDLKTTELENTRLNIEDDRQVLLSNERLDIKDENDPKLSDKKVDLKQVDNIDGLPEKKLELDDSRKLDLPGEKEKLPSDFFNKESELSTKRLDIFDSLTTELSEKRLDIFDESDPELSNKIIKNPDNQGEKEVSDLESKRIDLDNFKDISLGDKRLDLTDENDINLEDKRLDLTDDRNSELEDKRIDISDDRDTALEDKKINITDERDNQLTDKRLDLTDERDNKLQDKILNITDDRENELEDKKLDLEDSRENKLQDKRLDLTDDRDIDLEDKRLDLEYSNENELEDKVIPLTSNSNTGNASGDDVSLSNKILNLGDERENFLYDSSIGILKNINEEKNGLEDKRLDIKDERDNSLEDDVQGMLDNLNGEPEELYDSFIGIIENQNEEQNSLEDKIQDLLSNQNKNPEKLEDKIHDILSNQHEDQEELVDKILNIIENHGKELTGETLKELTSKLSDDNLYNLAMKITSSGEHASGPTASWFSKVSAQMSAYLSSSKLRPKRALEYREAINNTLKSGYFGARAALRAPIDTTSGTIWAKAEEEIGPDITGTTRRDALDETIVKLLDYKRINLPRVPGHEDDDDLSSAITNTVKGAKKNAVGLITGNSNHPTPMNKPFSTDLGVASPGGYGDTLFQAANNRTNKHTVDPVGDTVGNTFYNRYWKAESFKQTLKDLCPITGAAPVVSLFQLKQTLSNSPYITTPGRFMTSTNGIYNTFSLDSNMYWEVTIEPYCKSASGSVGNGGFSYLPSIQEINVENQKDHGVSTNYGMWAPINSFELNKSKLNTKSLQLYDGEIVFPVGMEFTNELRLTFVDDNWKSWRRYFEKCAEVAVYNSETHDKSHYEKKNPVPTAVDKKHICIALYKNITFLIGIYILNPQYNLLKKYGLLCVLKDFTEEYVGEVDSSGADLNVSFSIVGEDIDSISVSKNPVALSETIGNLAQTALVEAQNLVQNAISSSVTLL